MTLDWWTLGLQTINVVILIWLLSKFLFKPVARIIAERQAQAGQMLDEAQASREAAQAERDKAQALTRQLDSQRAGALKSAQEEAVRAREQMLQAAEQEVREIRRQAEQSIEGAHDAARRAAEQQATQLALDIAARLLQRLPPALLVEPFIDGLGEALKALPDGVRRALAEESEPLELRAPRPLEPAEREACERCLQATLGAAVKVDPQVDPHVVAGLELRGASAEARNSFRADLQRLAQELQHGGR